jgi:hypothetical protein
LGDEDRERFDSIQNFFSPYHNYASYRQKLRTSVPPIVPFMALFLTDLTFIDENEDKVSHLCPASQSARSLCAHPNPDELLRNPLQVARKKTEAESAEGGADAVEHDAKEAHDERPDENSPTTGEENAASQSFAATEEENKELVNFQKMELVGTL